MKIAYVTAGAAGMMCGSCMRDNTLVAALTKLGHDALLIWGLFLRVVVGWHLALAVNLFGHRSGYRHYPTPDNSRNCWWLTLLTFGEGWHNNHHHQPRSAAHGHRWYEVDVPYLFIRGLELVGLASDVIRPQREPGGAGGVARDERRQQTDPWSRK